MIVGIGVDVVAVARFARALERTPALAERLFTPAELTALPARQDRAASLAARFAAKEALAKALGAPGGLRWHDVLLLPDRAGRPRITVSGTVAAAAPPGVVWHVSLTHDAGVAAAVVVAETPAWEAPEAPKAPHQPRTGT